MWLNTNDAILALNSTDSLTAGTKRQELVHEDKNTGKVFTKICENKSLKVYHHSVLNVTNI